MLRVNYFILPIFTILLSACGSTPTVTYTPEGEKYFASNDKKYSNVRVAVASTNEAKAIK
jgi:ABC-type uncharacterized transport system auxiliary subunit